MRLFTLEVTTTRKDGSEPVTMSMTARAESAEAAIIEYLASYGYRQYATNQNRMMTAFHVYP